MLRYLANTRLAVEEWKMTYFPLVQPGVLRKVVKSRGRGKRIDRTEGNALLLG